MDAKEPWEDCVSSPDFEITVGDSVIKCHKVILGLKSPKFKTMFETKMVESDTNKLTIKEIDEKTYLIFLRYLYSPEKKISFEDLSMELLNVANEYMVDSIVEAFNESFDAFVNVDNVIECAILASQHESRYKSSWRYKLVTFIAYHYHKLKKRESFQRLQLEVSFMVDLFNRLNLDANLGFSKRTYVQLEDVKYSLQTFSPCNISFRDWLDIDGWNLQYCLCGDFLRLHIKKLTYNGYKKCVMKLKIRILYGDDRNGYDFQEVRLFDDSHISTVDIPLRSDFNENSTMLIKSEIYYWLVEI